jgi:hypothetical protein
MNDSLLAWQRLAVPCLAMAVASTLAGQSTANLTWASSTLPGGPSARANYAAAGIGIVSLFGGRTAAGASNQSWILDESGWTLHPPSGTWPAARSHAAMSYLFNSLVLMFGGRGANGAVLGDTWYGGGSSWNPISTSNAPAAREGAAMAPSFGMVLLFGGRDAATTFGDTWAFQANSWLPLPLGTTTPPARYGHAMTNRGLGTTNTCLLFGGRDAAGNYLDDTWVCEPFGLGYRWIQAQPLLNPSARAEHTLRYDSQRNRVQLFGGTDGTTWFNDLYEWDGANWTPATIGAAQPGVRSGAALLGRYNSATNSEQVVLFGGAAGTTLFGDAWTLGSTYPARCSLFNQTLDPINISPQTQPWLGESIRFGLTPFSLQLAHLIAGFSNTTSPLGPLPVNLGPVFNNTILFVDPLVIAAYPVLPPRTVTILLPPDPAFTGIHIYFQAIAVSSAGSWVTSHGWDCMLGWR